AARLTAARSHPAPKECFQTPGLPLVAPSLPLRRAPLDLQLPSAGEHRSLPAIRGFAAENRSSKTISRLPLLRLDVHHRPNRFDNPLPSAQIRGQLLFPLGCDSVVSVFLLALLLLPFRLHPALRRTSMT